MNRSYLPPPPDLVEIDMTEITPKDINNERHDAEEQDGLDEIQMKAELAMLRERNVSRAGSYRHRHWE